ncbi:MAG: TonB-dependent receptor plug domain-containing protein, partial [Myxococcota bacterium]
MAVDTRPYLWGPLIACLCWSPAVHAQADSASSEAPSEASAELAQGPEEITVTGTRIKRRSIATAAPVSVLTKEDLLATGRTTVAEILQRLPVNQNGLNVQSNNGGNGSSQVNLRSLGANRTLVL